MEACLPPGKSTRSSLHCLFLHFNRRIAAHGDALLLQVTSKCKGRPSAFRQSTPSNASQRDVTINILQCRDFWSHHLGSKKAYAQQYYFFLWHNFQLALHPSCHRVSFLSRKSMYQPFWRFGTTLEPVRP